MSERTCNGWAKIHRKVEEASTHSPSCVCVWCRAVAVLTDSHEPSGIADQPTDARMAALEAELVEAKEACLEAEADCQHWRKDYTELQQALAADREKVARLVEASEWAIEVADCWNDFHLNGFPHEFCWRARVDLDENAVVARECIIAAIDAARR